MSSATAQIEETTLVGYRRCRKSLLPTMLGVTLAVALLAPELRFAGMSTISLAFVPLSCAWIGAFLARPANARHYGVRKLFLIVPIYVAFTSVARLMSEDSSLAMSLASIQWALYASYFLLPGAVGDRDRISLFQSVLPVVSALFVGAAIWSGFHGPIYPWVNPGQRGTFGLEYFQAVGTVGNQNGCATLIVLVLGPLLFLWRPHLKTLKMALVAACLVALALTASRTGITSLVAAAVVCAALGRRRGPREGGSLAVLILLLVVLVSAVTFRVLPEHASRLLGMGSYSYVADVQARSTQMWSRGMEDFAGSPILRILFGAGFRNMMRVQYGESGNLGYGSYHSLLVQALLDLGLVGVVLLVVWVGAIMAHAAQRTSGMGGLAVAWIATALAAQNFTEVFLYGPVQVLFLGMATWIAYEVRDERQTTESAPSDPGGGTRLRWIPSA